MSANGNGHWGKDVRILVADGPEPGWWVVRPALAVRRADAAPDDPYLLAFDDGDLELLVGRDAPLELRRQTHQTSPGGPDSEGAEAREERDANVMLARPRAS
jgi:hypothetical protein